MRKIYLMGVLLSSGLAFAQPVGSPPANNTNAQAAAAWYRGGNNPTSPNNIFGTLWNSDIWITTNNRYIAKFSTNNGLNGLNGTGDGLRINNMTPSAPVGLGEIDIFTTGSNGTEIRFGGSGNIYTV